MTLLLPANILCIFLGCEQGSGKGVHACRIRRVSASVDCHHRAHLVTTPEMLAGRLMYDVPYRSNGKMIFPENRTNFYSIRLPRTVLMASKVRIPRGFPVDLDGFSTYNLPLTNAHSSPSNSLNSTYLA